MPPRRSRPAREGPIRRPKCMTHKGSTRRAGALKVRTRSASGRHGPAVSRTAGRTSTRRRPGQGACALSTRMVEPRTVVDDARAKSEVSSRQVRPWPGFRIGDRAPLPRGVARVVAADAHARPWDSAQLTSEATRAKCRRRRPADRCPARPVGCCVDLRGRQGDRRSRRHAVRPGAQRGDLRRGHGGGDRYGAVARTCSPPASWGPSR